MARQTLSVVIPVYNVADIIGRCLDALTWADEVVVVDMFSTDETEAICRRYANVRFFQNRDYIYANFNYGLDRATGDWILRLDSDEVVSLQLAQEIQEEVLANYLKNEYPQTVDVERTDVTAPGFRLPRPHRTLLALAKVFFDLYIRRKGYRDGVHGFMCCTLNTFYLLVERCKLWEKHAWATQCEELVRY